MELQALVGDSYARLADTLADAVPAVWDRMSPTVDPVAYRLEATDLDWSWGDGRPVTATAAELVSLLCHRTLPDGRTLARTTGRAR